MRDALSIFDQVVSFSGNKITYQNVIENLNVLDYDYYFNITEQILQKDTSGVLLTLNEIIDNGFDPQHFIHGMGSHLRSLLVSKDQATVQLMEVSKLLQQRYAEQARKCDPQFLLQALDINNQCDLNYRASNNKRLHLEITLLQLCALSGGGLPAANKKYALPNQKLLQPKLLQQIHRRQNRLLLHQTRLQRLQNPPIRHHLPGLPKHPIRCMKRRPAAKVFAQFRSTTMTLKVRKNPRSPSPKQRG